MRRRRTHKSQPSWFNARADPLEQYVSPSSLRPEKSWWIETWNWKLTKPRHRRSSAEGRCPSPAAGYALVAGSLLFLVLGSYAVFFSAFVPVTGVWVRVLLLL